MYSWLERRKPKIIQNYKRRGGKKKNQGNFSPFLRTSVGPKASWARGSLLPPQANIKAGAEQVGKQGLRVEPSRYCIPTVFMPPLTKGYGRKYYLSFTQWHSEVRLKQQPPSLTLFRIGFWVCFSPAKSDRCLTIFYFHIVSPILTLFCFFLIDTGAPTSLTGWHFHYLTLSSIARSGSATASVP